MKEMGPFNFEPTAGLSGSLLTCPSSDRHARFPGEVAHGHSESQEHGDQSKGLHLI